MESVGVYAECGRDGPHLGSVGSRIQVEMVHSLKSFGYRLQVAEVLFLGAPASSPASFLAVESSRSQPLATCNLQPATCNWLARITALCTSILSSLCIAAAEIQLPLELNAFKQDQGAELANAQCLICHSVEYVSTQPPMPRAFWKGSIQKMQQKYGAAIPEEQVESLADYLARNYGASTNEASTSPPRQTAPPTKQAVIRTDAADGPKVATKYLCFGCHSAEAKLVGPAYREVARKYKSDPEAAAKIAEQVHKGGSGKWGSMIMPPFPQVSDGETKVLIDWILGMN
jgi:cytochrome c551/c552